MNIDHMLLIGHSFGGFLAANYSIAFPHRVAGLILASPVGVPHADPNSAQVRADRIEQSSSCMRGCLYRLIYKVFTHRFFIFYFCKGFICFAVFLIQMLERSMAPQSIIRCCGPCGTFYALQTVLSFIFCVEWKLCVFHYLKNFSTCLLFTDFFLSQQNLIFILSQVRRPRDV
jgi:hypothetical protein